MDRRGKAAFTTEDTESTERKIRREEDRREEQINNSCRLLVTGCWLKKVSRRDAEALRKNRR